MNSQFPMALKIFDPDDIYDPSILESFPRQEASIELFDENCMFLAGLIKRYRPRTLLEVGVSAGGASALMLHVLDKLGLESELVSVDLQDRWFHNKEFATGWAAKKLYSGKKSWHLHTGKFLPEIIEDLNLEFDFCFLDTAHAVPGEILDYLVVLPFMREGGVVALHDTALCFFDNHSKTFATRILLDTAVGKKIIPPRLSEKDANLGAFEITADTYKYVRNVFSVLCMPWGYLLDRRQLQIYQEFFLRYYGPQAAEWFAKVAEWNTAHFIKSFRKVIKQGNRRPDNLPS